MWSSHINPSSCWTGQAANSTCDDCGSDGSAVVHHRILLLQHYTLADLSGNVDIKLGNAPKTNKINCTAFQVEPALLPDG